jgi:hypothetical protein
LGLGADCTANGQCASGSCQRWFLDADGDQHGSSDPSTSIQVCTQLGQTPRAGFVLSSDDCCDVGSPAAAREQAAQIFGGQAAFFSDPQTACSGLSAFDYNCDGSDTKEPRPLADCTEPACRTGLSPTFADSPCGAAVGFLACTRAPAGPGNPETCRVNAGGMDRPIACH